MDFRNPFRVVTPTLDGDVLAVLAGADAAFTSGDIHRLVESASAEGIRQVLTRLTDEGVVTRERAGRAYLYRLNREHIAAQWIEGIAGLRRQVIERLRETLAGWPVEAKYAFVFGSVARGEADPASDLDILVIRPAQRSADDEEWEAQVMALELAATAWTGNDARVLEYGEDELHDLAGKEPVLEDAARDGIELVGSLRGFRRIVERKR